MPKFASRKLIRDNIIDQHLEFGHTVEYRMLSGKELKSALQQKLHEEADEVPIRDDSDDEIIEELADVQQVVDDLKNAYGLLNGEVEKAQKSKRDKKGGFQKGVYIDTVEADESDEWVKYYRKHFHKYHEFLPSDEQFAIPTIQPGIYQHYKGNKYEVLFVGCSTEKEEYFVVYKALYEKENVPKIWIRLYDMFVENVTVDGNKIPRFKKLDNKA